MYIIEYVSTTLVLFFITFFIGIFIRFAKTARIIPAKMLSAQKGGLFEHYKIVAAIIALLVIMHLIGFNPYAGDNVIAALFSAFLIAAALYIVLVFIFVFLFYFIAFLHTKVAKIEDREAYYTRHNYKLVLTALVLALIMVLVTLIPVFVELITGS